MKQGMNGYIVARDDARPGDVVLFHRDTTFPQVLVDHGMWMTALIHWTTQSRYNHAAIVVGPDLLAEATDHGISLAALSAKTDGVTVIRPVYRTAQDIDEAVSYAKAKVGLRYGYLAAFMCGANHVLVGLHLVIKHDDQLICSEFVAEALERAGADFDTDTSLVSPGDLATFFGLPR
jgi:uncharacterized protein YycO